MRLYARSQTQTCGGNLGSFAHEQTYNGHLAILTKPLIRCRYSVLRKKEEKIFNAVDKMKAARPSTREQYECSHTAEPGYLLHTSRDVSFKDRLSHRAYKLHRFRFLEREDLWCIAVDKVEEARPFIQESEGEGADIRLDSVDFLKKRTHWIQNIVFIARSLISH